MRALASVAAGLFSVALALFLGLPVIWLYITAVKEFWF